jgi:hypothetical protein
MFVCLWLLASMVLDAVTPDEFSVYVIGAAIAPAMSISGILYWLRVPAIDFALVFAVLWMISEMALEMVAPKPLSQVMALVAIAPMLVVGTVLYIQRGRKPKPRRRDVPPTAAWPPPGTTEAVLPREGITLNGDHAPGS